MTMLQPWNDKIESEGKVTYHEASGAWNTVRLKRIFLEQFPQLKDKRATIRYKVEFYRNYDQIIETIQKMKQKKAGIPLLLYLYKEDQQKP